jgi:hypothetical protein
MIRAPDSWFVKNTITVAHHRPDDESSPLIFSGATLGPGAVEFVELFGLAQARRLFQAMCLKEVTNLCWRQGQGTLKRCS